VVPHSINILLLALGLDADRGPAATGKEQRLSPCDFLFFQFSSLFDG